MSDEQSGVASEPDDSEPSQDRQAELRAAYAANVTAGRAPYEDVWIRTRGELQWVMREQNWSGELLDHRHPANLSGAILVRANLSGMRLHKANLSRADLRRTDLSGADLSGAELSSIQASGVRLTNSDLRGVILHRARLSGASLTHAFLFNADLTSAELIGVNLGGTDLIETDLSDTNLRDANLQGSDLRRASLHNADLNGANLNGAQLTRTDLSSTELEKADLSGADLRGARMDGTTVLSNIKLNSRTLVGDVVWNGASLTQVKWMQARTLGDELAITAAKGRQERITMYRTAARAYRGLAIALRTQGVLIPASHYRLRDQRLERRALLLEGKLGSWLFSCLLDLVSGYGERPGRALVAYLAIVISFAGAYYGATHFLRAQLGQLAWYEALVLSISSFHGRGFFQPVASLGDPVAVLAAGEAVIGLFIELIFIATFSRRFLGN